MYSVLPLYQHAVLIGAAGNTMYDVISGDVNGSPNIPVIVNRTIFQVNCAALPDVTQVAFSTNGDASSRIDRVSAGPAYTFTFGLGSQNASITPMRTLSIFLFTFFADFSPALDTMQIVPLNGNSGPTILLASTVNITDLSGKTQSVVPINPSWIDPSGKCVVSSRPANTEGAARRSCDHFHTTVGL